MTLQPIYTRQFEKDIRRMRRRRKEMEKLKLLLSQLVDGKLPDPLHRDHLLIGNWQGRRECHVESDWLLIYKPESERIIFERTGSHADLFGK
ncbi:MAG: type II toxin-antitoxin system YafQ family toxin [Bacteroidetes bacterium]|nr:type II toxin-antitoxin system YafQ family toxin [Bacteroidota bacterium]